MQRLNSNAYDTQIMGLEEEFGVGAGVEAIFQDLVAIGESSWADWVFAFWLKGGIIDLGNILERIPCDLRNRLK